MIGNTRDEIKLLVVRYTYSLNTFIKFNKEQAMFFYLKLLLHRYSPADTAL